jgi:hypothetical protein
MITLNETQLKPSIVLSAMVTGLLKSKVDANFRVKMETFGTVENSLCYGCAATLTLAEIFGEGSLASEMMINYAKTQACQRGYDEVSFSDVNLPDVIRSETLNAQDSWSVDIEHLECALDSARRGNATQLIAFCTGEENTSFDHRWLLETDNWEEQIPKIEATIAEMIAAGY